MRLILLAVVFCVLTSGVAFAHQNISGKFVLESKEASKQAGMDCVERIIIYLTNNNNTITMVDDVTDRVIRSWNGWFTVNRYGARSAQFVGVGSAAHYESLETGLFGTNYVMFRNETGYYFSYDHDGPKQFIRLPGSEFAVCKYKRY